MRASMMNRKPPGFYGHKNGTKSLKKRSFGIPKTGHQKNVNEQSKIKKFLIEIQSCQAKDVVSNYKTFRVHVRADKKLCYVADVDENAAIEWKEDGFNVEAGVKEALADFIEELDL